MAHNVFVKLLQFQQLQLQLQNQQQQLQLHQINWAVNATYFLASVPVDRRARRPFGPETHPRTQYRNNSNSNYNCNRN